MTTSIDSTLSPFRVDKISLDNVKFIQNLLKTDDKQSMSVALGDSLRKVCHSFTDYGIVFRKRKTELPYLWQKLDASVLALERLSAAVNKPEQLERLIGESKKLLKHTTESSDAASNGRFSTCDLAVVVDASSSDRLCELVCM